MVNASSPTPSSSATASAPRPPSPPAGGLDAALTTRPLPRVAAALPARAEFAAFAPELHRLAGTWMQSALFARERPDGIALHSAQGTRSFAQLHAAANQVAAAFAAMGCRPGDAVALLCGNRVEFVEVLLGALRSGLRLTPISPQLTADEVAYILKDSGARVWLAQADLPGARATCATPPVLIGSHAYSAWLHAQNTTDPAQAQAGSLMLYTSGTTGRPKGVFRRVPDVVTPQFEGSFVDFRAGDVQLCAGPAYHSAPLLFDLRWPLASGVPIVLLPQWDSLGVLLAIERHRISHAHMVPTMFHRLLSLPGAQREAVRVNSLRLLMHGAAPCPVATKQAMIDWFGPILLEYYAGTEGGDNIHVNSVDWLRKPGTVGRLDRSKGHRVVTDEGKEAAVGQIGRIYFRAPVEGRFEYLGDAEKTAAAYADDRYTLGDLGFVDDEGWLFLTGRGADTVISGGVNLYPKEVDDVLLSHPAVAHACTVGAPDEEWGERLVSLVVLAAGHEVAPPLEAALKQSLQAHVAERLAAFKRPKEIHFVADLPYTATGKLLRAQVRARFWAGRDKSI